MIFWAMEVNDMWLSSHILTQYKFLIDTFLVLASLNISSLIYLYMHNFKCSYTWLYVHDYKFSYAKCIVHVGFFFSFWGTYGTYPFRSIFI